MFYLLSNARENAKTFEYKKCEKSFDDNNFASK